MLKPPTDRTILKAIYARYYEQYAAYDEEDPDRRSSKIWMPIDLDKMAAQLSMEPDILFGRLYYHLNKRYGYTVDDQRPGKEKSKMRVEVFALRVGGDHHCLHFPLLASVLASLEDENKKYRLATTMSIIALGVSLLTFLLKTLGSAGS